MSKSTASPGTEDPGSNPPNGNPPNGNTPGGSGTVDLRPGWGYGDKNHIHTGPPGHTGFNPMNDNFPSKTVTADRGNPDKSGKPEDTGKPADSGRPEGVGKPANKPDKPGKP